MNAILFYIFTALLSPVYANWTQGDTLAPLDIFRNDNFGDYLSIDGDLLAVASPRDDGVGGTWDLGIVYTFNWDGSQWVSVGTLQPTDLVNTDKFGSSLSLSGTKLVVGVPLNDDVASNAGKVYAFTWDGTTWNQIQILSSNVLLAGSNFGSDVSVSNDKLAISASSHDGKGAVFTYTWDGSQWIQDSNILIPVSLVSGDGFGYSVSMDGDKLVVGAYNTATGGSVYTFLWDGSQWVEHSTILQHSDIENGDRYGSDVALSGDKLAVASYLYDGANNAVTQSGEVFTYSWSGTAWIETGVLSHELMAYDYFGYSIDISGNKLIVGSTGNDDLVSNGGGAYIYDW
jgi:hypothetical protein